MILQPGDFPVNHYRKPIPYPVKAQKLIDFVTEQVLRHGVAGRAWKVSDLQYDHDPALSARPLDTETGDFIPPQHDPGHIVVMLKADHLHKTTGRKPGAERTVTSAGSDQHVLAKGKRMRTDEAAHQAVLARKAGDHAKAEQILATTKPQRGKAKIPSRPFQKVIYASPTHASWAKAFGDVSRRARPRGNR